jgi:GNAT superfamily N-acetyltransferase
MKSGPASATKAPRRETLNLRVPLAERSLIDRAAQSSGKTRTDFILKALAASAVAHHAASGRIKRNMPDPIPVVVLGRLAISRTYQGKGLGRALFRNAAERIVHAADSIGIRALLVHAISDEAKSFYLRLGLEPSPMEPMTLMATLSDLKAALV